MPFEIPESWVWTSIGELFEHNTGKALNASNRDGKMMDYITTSNLYWDRFDLSVVKQMWFTEEELWRCTAKKGDLLICEGGDIGRAAIWNYDYDIRIQNHIHRLRGYKGINHRFYYFVFLLYKLSNRIGGKGVAIQGLSSGDLHKLEVPLPPEYEQIRLVKTIEKWFKFVDLLEQEQENLHTLVQSTKSKILDLAISGKLVPQDPNDEPAIELLRRINPAFKPCDNSHYENLPQGWAVCRLSDMVRIQNGFAFQSAKYIDVGIRIIRITNVQSGYIIDESPKFYPHNLMEGLDEYNLKNGDLLMSLTGNVGRVGIMPENLLPAALNQRVCCLKPKNNDIDKMYLFYYFQAEQFIQDCIASGKGVAQLNVSTEWLKHYIIQLPPKEEQSRIVKTIDALFSIIDKITAEL